MKRTLLEPIRIQSKDGRIFGLYFPDGKVKVRAGSFFRNVEVNSLRQNIRNQRSYLMNNGFVLNDQLAQDFVFDNPSVAISTLTGHMDTGLQAFVTMDNIEIGSYLEIDVIEDYEQKLERYKNKRFLVCNVTWMEKYQGVEPTFSTNWKFVQEEGFGYELLNFFDDGGFYYGFMEMNGKNLALNRIDSSCEDSYIDNVLVVWTSRSPEGKKTIVGYYKNATIFAKMQTRVSNEKYPWFYIKAEVEDSYLIPLEERTFEFPKKQANQPGRSSVWYGGDDHLKIAIIDYIESLENKRIHYKKARRIVEDDDTFGVISTNDIDKDVGVEPEYVPAPKPEKIYGSTASFKRSEAKAKRSLILAKYKCDLDSSHQSFITKNGKPYMEAHHLIPLNAQDDFEHSLDVDANIVCLCPNCHRKLHFGEDISSDLLKLYLLRKNVLEASGLYVTFEELKRIYD